MLTCNSINFNFGQAAILIGSQRDPFAAVAHCLAESFLKGATVKIPLNETKSQRYYPTHKAKILARARAKRVATLEATRQKDREYREAHPERYAEANRRWRENNPEAAKAAERKTDFNRREHRAEQYAANRDERLAQNQAWKDRSAEKISEYNRAYYQSHKIESAARRAVRDALRRGDLVKSDTCNRCPAPAVIGHHHSYEPEYWLDVEWLCKKCHVRHHAEENYVNQGRSDG